MGTVEKVTSADGTSIAVEREGDGPALVLVDAAGSFRGFGPMGALPGALAPEFTVVTYDRRGRGESADTAPYSVDKEVDDLRAVIEAAGGSAFVYGFSSGAVLALHAAACGLPITKLALLEPPLALDDEPSDPAEQDLQAEIAELIAADRRGDAIVQFNSSHRRASRDRRRDARGADLARDGGARAHLALRHGDHVVAAGGRARHHRHSHARDRQ